MLGGRHWRPRSSVSLSVGEPRKRKGSATGSGLRAGESGAAALSSLGKKGLKARSQRQDRGGGKPHPHPALSLVNLFNTNGPGGGGLAKDSGVCL